MLENLYIKNYALIESLELEFAPGMNTLTGETGAGKSILAGALGLLLGARATTASIRSGADQADVSGSFILPSSGEARSLALAWLDEQGIEAEDERIIIRRVLKSTGKGNSFIQGNILPRQKLEEFTGYLVDMHGQHEHQSLFNIQQHRKFIDSYGGLEDRRTRFQHDFLYLNDKRKELENLKSDDAERLREIELLRFAIEEIDALSIQAGEDESLEQERRRLQQYEKLFSHIQSAHQVLDSESSPDSVISALYNAQEALNSASVIDESLTELAGRLRTQYYELEDIFSQLSGYQDDLRFDPQRLEFIEERLAELHEAKRKYGGRIDAVLEYRQEAEQKLDKLDHSDVYAKELQEEIETLESRLAHHGAQLSKLRKETAGKLEREVQSSLSQLGMEKSKFSVSVTQKLNDSGTPVAGPNGMDRVEFLLSANAGEAVRPLRSIASGGEVSRVMLAIKTALADSDDISTLVFDEVDTGIGGEVGRALGTHLQDLSSNKQILCITHLASIAACADKHIQILKHEQDERSVTTARTINGEDRIREISRMLAGDHQTEAGLSHARQLLEASSR